MVFSQTIGPIELKFHVKTPYDKSAKIFTKYFGYMTKMAATPIYGKNLLVFSDNSWPIETKFLITTPYDWLAKTYTNCYGHMTNMATMPIYDQNSLNLFFSGTKRPLALGLSM